MSAFIVSYDLIDALLTYAIEHEVRFWRVDTQQSVTVTPFNATRIGRRLLNENCKSVEHRYPQDAGNNRAIVDTYEFRPFEGGVTHAEAAKACFCFEYQACEHNGWHTSRAHRIVNAIRWETAKSLPGYAEAPYAIERQRNSRAA